MNIFKPVFTITNIITAAITKIERARGFLDAAKLSDAWIQEMSEHATFKEAYYSTRIEGTTLTLQEARLIWYGKEVSNVSPDDRRELLNYRDAFDFVADSLDDGGPISEGMIREIHKRLVIGVRGDNALPGQYRTIQNFVVNSRTGELIYTPPPPFDVPPMMYDLTVWLNLNKEIHPIIVSGIAQFQLVHIHPFIDGNGRTSRLLSTLVLYKAGYDFRRLFTISEYYDRDRTAFYQALQSVRESDMDLTGWLEYFVVGLETQMQEARSIGELVIRRDALQKEHRLNDRQARALGHILEHGSIDIGTYQPLFPDVSRRTLQRDLKDMVEKKVLKVEGATHTAEYLLIKDRSRRSVPMK